MIFEEEKEKELDNDKVTIFLRKRNNRQSDTNIYGMAKDLDLKKILSYLKRKHNCSGAIKDDTEFGEVMTLTGDQKENVFNFLVDQQIYKKEQIIFKGI